MFIMRRTICAVIAIQWILINFCLGELSSEKKDEFVNSFIVSLNNLPNPVYNYEEGVLLDAQKTDDNTYNISARLKASEIHNVDVVKQFKCTGTIVENDNVLEVQQGHICSEEEPSVGTQDDINTESSLEDITTESTAEHGGPVKLYNEVQPDAEVTSGEQFVAIPRASPSSPCIGCASHVDPAAAGVTELATLGIRHLDLHDPDTKHALKAVVDVERQVQVVNGVRYILTLLVDYDNCTAAEAEPCPITTPCKVSILEKPWKKLPDGSKYRAIIANNCTAEWLFGDEGEVLPIAENNENNEIQTDPASNGDGIKVVHNFDVEAHPNQDKIVTEEHLKNIEEQIIPYSEFDKTEHHATLTSTDKITPSSPDNAETKLKTEQVRNYNDNAAVGQLPDIKHTNSLSKDKKKAIDDIMHYLDFVGFDKQEVIDNHQIKKRSYDDVLKLSAFAKNVQKNNKVINNASYMQKLAQAMVNHLNIVDLVIHNRVLTDILAAGEEFKNDQHFFYLQVLVTIPCNKQQCSAKDGLEEICNGVIETYDENSPRILNAFCYEVDNSSNKGENILVEDPILIELVQQALQKIESEAPRDNAMKLLKILDATTYKSSGTLTKISISLAYTDCKKSVQFYDRMNCSLIENMGNNICQVEIYTKNEDDNMQIGYECTERRVLENFTESEQLKKELRNFNDPYILKMAEESLREARSDRKEKQELVAIKSVSTKLAAGLLTNLVFIAGYTNCDSDKSIDENICDLLLDVPLRHCVAEVWDRPWLKNNRQIRVKCKFDDNELLDIEDNQIKSVRKKRSKTSLLGGQTEKNVDDKKYKKLAQESFDTYRATLSSGEFNVKELKINKVTTQVVSGLITRIDFDVFPTKGDVITCHSKVYEQAWLNKKEITVNCDVNKELTREKRSLPGGQTEQNVDDEKYQKLAQESLDKYRANLVGGELNVKELKVTKVTTQVVSGIKTRIDFNVFPTNGDVLTCHSEIYERAWLNKKEITVNCDVNKELTREKRSLPGGQTERNVDGEKYRKLAQESLDKYRANLVGGELNVKELKVTKVTTQVVSGIKTRIDFNVFPTNGDVLTCHSEVYEQPWVNKKEITVECGLKNLESRIKRNILNSNPKTYKANFHTEDASKVEFRLLAEESLQQYMKRQNVSALHELVEVKQVKSQIVAGKLYEIDFTAAPSISQNNTILNCHAQVWSRPWLKSNEIDVTCTVDEEEGANKDVRFQNKENEAEHNDRDVPYPQEEINNKDKFALAQEVLHYYERLSNSKFKYKIISVGNPYKQITDNIVTMIEFHASPTQCLILDKMNVDECKLQKPELVLLCKSIVRERPWIFFKDIKVTCNDVTTTKSTTADWDDEIPDVKINLVGREKRNVIGEESDNYMDDDMKYYYADRAVNQINQNIRTHNLHKLITIHTVDVSTQMGARMVRMYIETAMTFCVRHQIDRVDLNMCDEMDGLPHRLCHVRLWPSPNDEMVIRHVVVVCNDNSEFSSVAGFDIAKLISASLRKLESSPSIKYKLVHQGQPYVIPALSSRYPIKMNFVVLRTNCTKDIDVFEVRDTCFIDSTSPAVSCESRIYLSPNSKDIKDIQAWCADSRRQRRDVNLIPTNITNVDATISKLVEESLEKLETSSLHSRKQRILKINSYTTKITRGRETRIDFDVGYTTCLKYESVKNVSDCEFLNNLPKRHCISRVYETLWVENGKNIEVVCKDDEIPLESPIEPDNAKAANQIANEALKHIEAKYPNPKKLRVVRIFSLQKQAIAGIHYRMKLEIGITDCPALSLKTDCKPVRGNERNKLCRVNVWIKPLSDHPPNYRVACDYQESETTELYHRMQAEHLFAHFVATYKPDYMNDHKEMATRFKVFRDNVRKVHELNIHEKGTARYAMTRFSDLTYEEFSMKYLGLKPSLRNENDIPMAKAEIPKLELPQAFDWRTHGAVTEVKNQGSCGSCWAFSVTGNVEGQWKLHSGKLVSLSEQELVDCDKKDQGCNGGLMDNAYRAIEELGGLETETDYPYEGEDDKCVFNHTLSRVQISGAVNISSNETEMAQWLVSSGPISIGINANAMQFYVGGISHPWKMLCSPKNLDHGVLIVGFGIKEYPLFNKHLPYWIVKNSWGPSWGEQGYYRVYRGDGTCGVNQMASSAVV